MEVTFPSRGWASAAAALGAAAVATTTAVFIIGFRDNLAALIWVAPFFGAYVAGLVAFRVLPGHLAARRLLVFGALATIWIGSTVGVVVAYEAQGNQWWLGPANVAVQFVGLGMEAAMIALLAVYPDGRYHRPYERRTVLLATVLAARRTADAAGHP